MDLRFHVFHALVPTEEVEEVQELELSVDFALEMLGVCEDTYTAFGSTKGFTSDSELRAALSPKELREDRQFIQKW